MHRFPQRRVVLTRFQSGQQPRHLGRQVGQRCERRQVACPGLQVAAPQGWIAQMVEHHVQAGVLSHHLGGQRELLRAQHQIKAQAQSLQDVQARSHVAAGQPVGVGDVVRQVPHALEACVFQRRPRLYLQILGGQVKPAHHPPHPGKALQLAQHPSQLARVVAGLDEHAPRDSGSQPLRFEFVQIHCAAERGCRRAEPEVIDAFRVPEMQVAVDYFRAGNHSGAVDYFRAGHLSPPGACGADPGTRSPRSAGR